MRPLRHVAYSAHEFHRFRERLHHSPRGCRADIAFILLARSRRRGWAPFDSGFASRRLLASRPDEMDGIPPRRAAEGATSQRGPAVSSTDILLSLPRDLRNKLTPLIERAGLPFHASLDRIVADFFEPLVTLHRLGASLTDLVTILNQIGVTTRSGRPITEATLSKSLSRARANSTDSTSSTSGVTGSDRGDFVVTGKSPHATEVGDLRRAATNGGSRWRGHAADGDERRFEAVRDDIRHGAAKRGAARQTAANDGKTRRPKALADGTRPDVTAAVELGKQKTSGRCLNGAAPQERARSREFKAALTRGAQLNSVMEKTR